MHSRLKLLFAVNGVGALITMGFLLSHGKPFSVEWITETAPFLVFSISPFVVCALAGFLLRAHPTSLGVLLAAGILLVLVSLGVLGMAVASDVAVVIVYWFMFLPLFLLIGLVPFLLTAYLLQVRDAT